MEVARESQAEDVLVSDEAVLLETRQHRYVIVRESVLAVVGVVVLLVAGSNILARIGANGRDSLVVIGAIVIGLVAGLVVGRAVWRIICWRYTWYIVTDRRVMVRAGVATRRTTSAWFGRVSEVGLEVPYLARVLRRFGGREYGHLTVQTSTDAGLLGTLSWIPEPIAAAMLVTPRAEPQGADSRAG